MSDYPYFVFTLNGEEYLDGNNLDSDMNKVAGILQDMLPYEGQDEIRIHAKFVRPEAVPTITITGDGNVEVTWSTGRVPTTIPITPALLDGIVNRQNAQTRQITELETELTMMRGTHGAAVREAYEKGMERDLSGD